jgi:hypothetical protein
MPDTESVFDHVVLCHMPDIVFFGVCVRHVQFLNSTCLIPNLFLTMLCCVHLMHVQFCSLFFRSLACSGILHKACKLIPVSDDDDDDDEGDAGDDEEEQTDKEWQASGVVMNTPAGPTPGKDFVAPPDKPDLLASLGSDDSAPDSENEFQQRVPKGKKRKKSSKSQASGSESDGGDQDSQKTQQPKGKRSATWASSSGSGPNKKKSSSNRSTSPSSQVTQSALDSDVEGRQTDDKVALLEQRLAAAEGTFK